MKIIFATNNQDKLKEVNEIAKDSGIEFVLPTGNFNPIEDGTTFLENAYKKAIAVKNPEFYVLADDSGLCVDALDGAPGLYSARYAGSQAEKFEKLLFELKNKENRSAKFVCSMVLLNNNREKVFETIGNCFGEIVLKPKGRNGFGYDPIFKVEGYNITMAEMSEIEKNKISHRAKALQNVIKFLK